MSPDKDAPSAAGGRGRLRELDGWRAVAVVMVVGYHAAPGLFPGGELGVELFFVLSGFLITWRLLDEYAGTGQISLRSFYGRRAARLLPALGLLLGAYVLVTEVAFASGSRGRMLHLHSVAVAASYGTNWVLARGGPISVGLGHLWSLAIEEQFYLVWPLLLVLLLRITSPRRLVPVALSLAAASMAWRELLWRQGASFGRVYFGFDTRSSSLFLGCALGAAMAAGWLDVLPKRRVALAAGFGTTYLAWAVVREPARVPGTSPQFEFALAGLACLFILTWVVTQRGSGAVSVLDNVVARYLGERSYGIYLWHFTALEFMRYWWHGAGAVGVVGGVLFGIAAAHLSFAYIERPVQRWRSSSKGRGRPVGVLPLVRPAVLLPDGG